MDTLVQATQVKEWDPSKEVRYTDTRKDEQERELGIKSTPCSLVLENLKVLMCLSMYLSMCLSMCLSMYLCTYLSIYLSI
jgi:translation elongation factor EF-G